MVILANSAMTNCEAERRDGCLGLILFSDVERDGCRSGQSYAGPLEAACSNPIDDYPDRGSPAARTTQQVHNTEAKTPLVWYRGDADAKCQCYR